MQAAHQDLPPPMSAALPTLKEWKTLRALKRAAEDEPPCTGPLTHLCAGDPSEPAPPASVPHHAVTQKTEGRDFSFCTEEVKFFQISRVCLGSEFLLLIARAERGRSPRTSSDSAPSLAPGDDKETGKLIPTA